jgi:putative CocE/NonD family hydrolase
MPGEFSYPLLPNIFSLLDAGYAVVWQDCRGVFGSEGQFEPLTQESMDGTDAVAWLAQQKWCDGNVGMYGHSYLGVAQWAAAAGMPEGLKAIAPSVSGPDWYKGLWRSEGGAIAWHQVWSWLLLMTLLTEPAVQGNLTENAKLATAELDDPDSHLGRLPIANHPIFAEKWKWFLETLDHSERDNFWKAHSPLELLGEVEVPSLTIGGWFDPFVNLAAKTFTALREDSAAGGRQDFHRLIIGPWDHLSFSGAYHDRQFGLDADVASADLTSAYIRFFDRNLRGLREPDDPRVKIFVMGLNQWRSEDEWPLPDTEYVDYFLHSEGLANTLYGDGTLTTEMPTSLSVDSYIFDPANPVPTVGGRILRPASLNACGPVDQRRVETRDDVLCFTTEPLKEPLEVTGHVSLEIFVSSTASDTDFTGKLVDVAPDGTATYLTDGILRARYRNSLEIPEFLEPGTCYELRLDLSVTSNVFHAGHRLRLEISSSNFPRYDRNTNSGGAIAFDGVEDLVVAHNQVFHGPDQPSRLILPVIRR